MPREVTRPDGVSAAKPARVRFATRLQLVRLAAPSLGGVVRLVLIVAASAIFLYLCWRVREVIRLVPISLFVALALFPVVDAMDGRFRRLPRSLIILTAYAQKPKTKLDFIEMDKLGVEP